MGDAVIVSAARTAIGTARKGSLADVSAFDLARFATGEALRRSGIDPQEVDDLILGESLQGGGDIARYTAVSMGLESIPGAATNRHCASGLTAVQAAAASLRAGMDRVVIAAPRASRRCRGRRSACQGRPSRSPGCRRATPRRRRRRRSTCRSPSAGTAPGWRT
jgi:acetyl-CoA C-acetyltransferase